MWQEYTEELYKKDLYDQDNHNDVITHLESDILESDVKLALGSITINPKASGDDGIPVELFQILKDDAVKVLHSMICWIIENAREFQKNIYFCFIDYAKAFDSVDHRKLLKILKEVGIPDHLSYLLRNLCACQEATVRTRHGTMDWFQMEKGVLHSCILSPCLINFYADYII